MKSRLLLLVFLLLVKLAIANNGIYVSNIMLVNKAEKWCWSIAQDASGNMLFGTERGVIVYDGVNQQLVETPSTPMAIKIQHDNIWICGDEYLGILVKNEFDYYEYQELKTYPNLTFSNIIIHNSLVYFISDSGVILFNTADNKIIEEVYTDDQIIENAVVFKNEVYFLIDYFLYTIKESAFFEQDSDNMPVDEFSYVIAVNDNLILGTPGKTAYSYSGSSFNPFEIKSPFFDNNLVTNAKKYVDNKILLSSIAGGIAILNYDTKKIETQVGFFNGLPDDEIRTSYIDNNEGIWVSHEFGISRIDVNMGIESYNYYPGLKGNPLAIKYFENNIYVATNDGLFVLDEIKDYNEFTVKVNVPVSVSVPVKTSQKKHAKAADDKGRKGLFGRKSKSKSDEAEKSTNKTVTKTIQRTRTIKKRSLKSVSHYFTLIEGMSGKFTQMAIYNNYLLVAGNNGLFAIKNKKSEPVLKDLYVTDIYIANSDNKVYCATNNGLYRVYYENDKWELDHFAQTTNSLISSVCEGKDGNWIIASDDIIVRAKFKYNDIEVIHEVELPEKPGQTLVVRFVNNELLVIDSKSKYIFTLLGELNKIETFDINNYILSNQFNYTWHYNNKNWQLLTNESNAPNIQSIKQLKLFGSIRYADIDNNNNIWLINDENLIYKLSEPNKKTSGFNAAIIGIQSNNKTLKIGGKIKLDSKNNLKATFSAPYYLQQQGVQYSYLISGLNSNWSQWFSSPEISIGYVPPGSYTLKYKAKNSLGIESGVQTLNITVPKPFTQSVLFYAILLIVFIAITYIIFKLRLQKLKKDKEILEQKVKERTATIEEQKSKIEKQHDEITGSIRYAERIQSAMLPDHEIIEAMLPDHFILFNPRDIVSGDFYFFKPIGNKVIFVAADCTGHGVPGGFMSMVGLSFLGEITSILPIPTASEIIDHLREKIKITLGQTEENSTQKDGMDLALCVVDFDNNQVQYAGAFNPLIIIREGELDVVKADRQPVAVYVKESEFTNHVIDVKPGDSFYMFSDGYPDQIGGPKQRKFMSKNFKNLLLEHHKLPMPDQKAILQKSLDDWRGESMQVDDVLVVGFRL